MEDKCYHDALYEILKDLKIIVKKFFILYNLQSVILAELSFC